MNFGGRIKAAREHLEWTAVELASRSGVANTTIGALENRDSKRSEYAEALIAAFPQAEISHSWLRTGAGTMSARPEGWGAWGGPDEIKFSEQDSADYTPGGAILAWEHPDDLPEGEFVMIPRLDVHLSTGAGSEQVEIEFTKAMPQAFRADWIRRKRLKPGRLASMYAKGDSMEPRIFDKDSLVVDTSQVDVVDDGVYALWYDGGERVKRLYRRPGGGLRIKSDNPRYDTIELSASELEHVRIIGRVVQISSEGGL
jgi:phage repressor protein C with HTH and peptisase S24 domain